MRSCVRRVVLPWGARLARERKEESERVSTQGVGYSAGRQVHSTHSILDDRYSLRRIGKSWARVRLFLLLLSDSLRLDNRLEQA